MRNYTTISLILPGCSCRRTVPATFNFVFSVILDDGDARVKSRTGTAAVEMPWLI